MDYVETVPEALLWRVHTEECPVAAMMNEEKRFYGVQFHPEVMHTPFGKKMFSNFLFDICGLSGDWSMSSFAQTQIEAIREKVGDKNVLCAMSGGVDSSVAAVLVHKAVVSNSPASLLTMACFVRTKATKWNKSSNETLT